MTSGRLSVLLTAVLSLSLIAGCKTNKVADTAGTQPIPIVEQITGDDSGFKDMDVRLVNSPEDLTSLGSAELITKGVDLAQYSLVLVALGEQPTGGYAVTITGVQKSGDRLLVQGLVTQPAPDQAATQALTYPYAAAVIAKTEAASVHPEIESAGE